MSETGDGTSTFLQLNGDNQIASSSVDDLQHAGRLFVSWT